MTQISDRYEKVSDQFGARVREVPADAWDAPAPCDGWVARDVVRHLTEWVPAYLTTAFELEVPAVPSVDDDPAAAWEVVDQAVRAALTDPDIAGQERDTPMGRSTLEATLDMIVTGDVLIHTWDLARAAGLDESLDPVEVHAMYEGMLPMDQALRDSGHFGPRVDVPDSADEQTKLLAFTGRRP